MAPTNNGGTSSGGAKKAPRKRAATPAGVATAAEPVVEKAESVDGELKAIRDRLHQAAELAQQAAAEAQELRSEVGNARDRCRGTLNRAEADARDMERQLEEGKAAFERARQKQAEAEARARDALKQVEAGLADVQKARQRWAGVDEDSAKMRQKFEETEAYLQNVRQAFQDVGRELIDKTDKHLKESDQRVNEAREELEAVRAELAAAREEMRALVQEARRGEPRPAAFEPALTPRPAFADAPAPASAAHCEFVETDEAEDEGTAVIHAAVRPEPPGERLARHVNHAWAVEEVLADSLQEMAEEVIDPTLRDLFAAHRLVTVAQRDALAERLKALGKTTTSSRGVLGKVFGKIWDSWQREPDDCDRTIHTLIKAVGVENYEVAMYDSLAALADAFGDPVTAELARKHRAEERDAASNLLPYLVSTAKLAFRLSPVTNPEPAVEPEVVTTEENLGVEPADADTAKTTGG